MPANLVLLVARVLLSIIFLMSGFGKLTDIAGTASYFANYGLPAPSATAVIVGLVELLGGLAILVGFKTPVAAWLLAIFSVASALVAHTDFGDQMQMINFLKNLAMAGGFLALAVSGAGAYSIDGRRRA
ncbi:MAG: DoxX family protein [Rhizobiaceae bacterium]|jgi:putative oxidoreductase